MSAEATSDRTTVTRRARGRSAEPPTLELVLKRNAVERLKREKSPLGILGELPTLFPATFPLTPRPLAYGAFDVQIQALRAGTSAVFELSGTAAGAQLLHISDAISGGAPAPTLRLKIVRIE